MKRSRKSGIPYWAYWGDRGRQAARGSAPIRKAHFEALEPRVLLAADFPVGGAEALAGGLDQFGDRVVSFLDAEGLFDVHVPLIVQTETNGEEVQNVAPTLNSLFAIPEGSFVDGNALDAIGDDDGKVEAAEFIKGWFFDKVENVLPSFNSDRDGDGDVDTEDFANYLRNGLDHSFNLTIDGVAVTLDFDVDATDLTQDETVGPVADLMFDVDFTLKVSQDLQLDLGTGADALKLLAFTDSAATPASPVIPVDTTMQFGFVFGIHTGGQLTPADPTNFDPTNFDPAELNAGDFFVRSADPLYARAVSQNTGVGFHLNIGFLGADVVNGKIDFAAAVNTTLVDPDSPGVLGFTTNQYGVEQTTGIVTGSDAIPSADLDHDAGFVLRIGNAGIATEVKVLDDGDNGTNLADLLVDVNEALGDAGLGGLVEASLDGSNRLVFTLVETTDTPMGFANEVYAADGVLQVDPDASEYTVNQSFLLSIGGGLPTLVNVRFADPAKTDIGFGDTQVADLPDLVGQNEANPNGIIEENVDKEANFTVRVTLATGSSEEVAVAVTGALAAPDPNTVRGDLVADINQALIVAGLNDRIEAVLSGSKIALRKKAGTTVSAIEILSAEDATTNDIGFVAGQKTTLTLVTAGEVLDSTLDDGIDSTNDDAHIEITVNGTLKTIVVAPGSADGAALATAIDDALEAKGLAIDAEYDASSNKIVLRAQDDSVLSFSIRTVNEGIDDLAEDVQRALNYAGIGDDVTVTVVGTNLVFTEGADRSLEMTKTLTLDAGDTYAELQTPTQPPTDGTATEELFLPEKDLDASKILLNLPIVVTSGVQYTPPNVAIVGNFTAWEPPADSSAWESDPPPVPRYDATPSVRRFDLFFTYTPEVGDQDSPVGPAPDPSTLTEELRLVNLAEPLNFNLITTESMIGMLMGLGMALQEIADSGLFAGYGIPFADASLADLFNFTDADRVRFSGLIDTALIYETSGDGVNGGPGDTDKLLRAEYDTGSETWILLPTFYTAQELASRLDAILPDMTLTGEGGINAKYDTVTDELTYELELLSGDRASVGIGEPFTAPFEYDVNLSPFAKLTIDAVAPEERTEVALQARTALSMTFGIDLSLPGNIIYPDSTRLKDLNGGAGIDIQTVAAVTGSQSVRVGVLSTAAHFDVEVGGTLDRTMITVEASQTTGNHTYWDLVEDINNAIGGTAANGLVYATWDARADRLKLVTAPDKLLRVKVWTPAEVGYYDTAFTELGFALGYSAAGQSVYAQRSPATGRLTGDAIFQISMNGEDWVDVSVAKNATNSNYSISDLVQDVDDALAAAGLGGQVKAGFNRSETGGTRLVLTAVNPLDEFTVNPVNSIAQSDLGLPPGATAGNRADFVVYDSRGDAYNVVLDDLTDASFVQDLIDKINDATTTHVRAELNASHTGLRLIETNAEKGGEKFRVEKTNGTGALLQLGLTSSGNQTTQNELGPGDIYRIDGGAIGLTHLDDRFFVRDAEIRLEALQLQTPEANTDYPAGVPGTALFGIVGLQTSLSGSLRTEVSAALKDPTPLDGKDQITLAELFEGGKQGRLTSDATFQVDIGEGPVTVTVPKIKTDSGTDVNNTIEDLVADVNEALGLAGLDGKIVAKAGGARLVFQAVKGSGITEFTITAGGTAVTEMGLRGTQTSVIPEGSVPTIEARAASRYAVEDPVVEKASELSYYADGSAPLGYPQFLGGFAAGQDLIGYDVAEVHNGDGDLVGYTLTETGRAKILEVRPGAAPGTGVLTLTHIEGIFYTADWLWAEGTAGVLAYHSPGEAAPVANFGDFNFHVTVQPGLAETDGGGMQTGFGAGFAAIDGISYDVPIRLTGFGNPFDPMPPTAVLDESGLGDLAAFEHLDYGHILAALQGLQEVVEDVTESFDLLNTKLPAINKSVSDLLSLVSGFARGVDNAEVVFNKAQEALKPEGVDLPALRLQDIARALRGAFGLPDEFNPDDWVTLDFDSDNNMLMISLSLNESISTKLGLDIDLPAPLPNLTSGGVLKATGSLDARLDFGIDLGAPEDAYLYDTSSIAASLTVEGEGQEGTGLVFRASLGPLGIFILGGDALIRADFALPGMNLTDGRKLISDVGFPDFIASDPTADQVDVVLPMFYGGEGPDNYLGVDFSAKGKIGDMVVVTPDFSGIVAAINDADVMEFDPFENILLGIDTVDFYLEALQDIVSGDILGITLPFVGDQMADVLFIEEFRNILVRTLKNGVENAIDPQSELIEQLLGEALGSGGPLAKYLKSDIVADDNVGTDANNSGGNPDFNDLWYWFRQWNFTLGDTINMTVEDFDLGIPNLGFDIDAPVQVKFTWLLDFGFGVDFARGAYIDVSDYDLDDVDLSIQLELSVPGTNMDGWLGLLKLEVDDLGSGVKLDFNVDVTKGGTTDPLLGFSDLGNIVADTEVWGDKLNSEGHAGFLDLESTIGGVSALPRLYTDLVIDWSIQTTPTGDNPLGAVPLENLGGNAVKAWVDRIEFQTMELDGGAIVNDILAPILAEINDIIQPFMPVVDVITAPIPVLSDLAGEPFTILDLAEIFGSVDAEFIETIADILTLIDKISDPVNFEPLPLGNLTVFEKGGVALFSPTAAPGEANYRLSDIDLGSLAGTVLAPNIAAFDAVVDAHEFLGPLKRQELAKGLTFPILTNALQGIGLLLDQDAVMVDYILPPLAVEFEYLQVFPVWGPLAVSIEISFGFTIDLHSVGFDTFGVRRYADGGGRNAAVIFDGFYLNDLDAEGVDAPEVTFEFGLVGAAELNLGIARAGVGGGIKAKIYFDWNDPIPDGRVHISEMVGNLLAAPEAGPLAIFDLGGALTFQLFAFLEISIIGFEQEFPITPETELFSFEVEIPKPPVLATKVGDTLILNIGPNSIDRVHGDTSDGHEQISLHRVGDEVRVYSSQFGVADGDPVNTFSGISKIVGMGGQGNDVIELYGFDGSGITAEFDGGDGDDRIEYMDSDPTASLSIPGARILGGTGNDILTGGEGNDTIVGGEGNDTIKGGGGYDVLFGDQGRIGSIPVGDKYLISTRIRVQDGDDVIEGGAGDDVLFGSGGNDILRGDAGDDLIIGDAGRFLFTYADGHIDLASIRTGLDSLKAELDAITASGNAVYVDPEVISDKIDAIYDAVVDAYRATDLGFGGNDAIEGGEGKDTVLGGAGDDAIQGEAGDDILLGGKGFDTISGGTESDTIFGGDQADTIDGNEGADVISGDAGNDYIHGNTGNDVMKGGRGADVMYGDEDNDMVFGQSDPDILFGGIGVDLVVGGTSNDIMFGDDGLVAKLDPDGDTTNDKVIGLLPALLGTGEFYDGDSRTFDLFVTTVVDGDGNDFLSGDAGDDYMFGGGGNDTMGGDVDPRLPIADTPETTTEIGEDILIGDGGRITFNERRYRSVETIIGDVTGAPFNDVIYGDNGNDYIFGGRGSDFLFGGHGKVVTAGVEGVFRGATDAVAADNDIIVGDNGELLFADNTIEDNFGGLELIRTTDESDATGGHEYAEGELGNDVIFGGVNGSVGVDVLFGNVGDDVILGDNGELDFAFGDTDLTTLDLIRSYRDGLGGIDIISGNAGDDVLNGGTAGDTMYGDDVDASSGAADGEDIMLGDNADIFLIGTVGRLKVQVAAMTAGTAVDLITTTDAIDAAHLTRADAEECGGPDTMSGNAGNDIMLGGVNNDDGDSDNGIEMDVMYGDRDVPTPATITNDGNDIMLGDNGELRFTLPGGINYDNRVDTDRNTLDLIRSKRDVLGGADFITGNKGQDVAIGGTGGDTIHGDDAPASAAGADLADMLVGDNADVFTRGAYGGAALLKALGTGVSLITTTDTAESTGGIDTISGNAAADVIFGGVAGDTIYGDAVSPVNSLDGDDVILGDNGKLDFAADRNLSLVLTGTFNLNTLDLIESFTDGLGGGDTISGNAGADTAMGGTADDTIYGDNKDAYGGATDKNDMLLGDNGYVWLVSPGLDVTDDGADRIMILGGAVALARSTDEPNKGPDPDVSSDTGGVDTISGNAGGDIILGGVAGDTLYGDRVVVTNDTNTLDGRDIILGDNGALEWLSTGRLTEVTGINLAMTNSALVDGFTTRDANLDTLDLITTEQPNNGGRDTIHGDNARDAIFGGTDADTLRGDTGSESDGTQSVNGNDLMFGDHGRLYPQFSRYMVNGALQPSNDIYARNFFAIDIGDTAGGEGDKMWGEEGDDTMVGQQGDDRMWGGSGDDDMTGGHNVSGGYDELTAPAIDADLNPAIVSPMPAIGSVNDLMDGGTGDDAMAGDNAIIWRRGDDLSPRFRYLTEDTIYTTTGNSITANVGATWQSDPADAIGRDIELVDHADATALGLYGSDVMAGGADSDTMFGELANDLMQGDGFIQSGGVTDGALTTRQIGVTDSGAPSTPGTLFFKVPEAGSDADDYLEGNGGDDLMYGGLGQDDMIGGSSALFGLTTEEERPDGSDVIFGGVGIATARNDIGETETEALASENGTTHVITTADGGHARDADYIMGDNANVFRLVETDPAKDAFLVFNYDLNYYLPGGYGRIIPRAMQQLDYTLGGGDFAGEGYNADGQAKPTGKPVDNGLADLIHGESGDDVIFGMTGSDVIFGEGQDDDVVGGYGNDWISGGTGQDGILGDDGLIYTSRNSSTYDESLYGIDALGTRDNLKASEGDVLNELITTPGALQYAVINREFELKKTIELVPFSFDSGWGAMDDEYPDNNDGDTLVPYADDILFGGLGGDFLHGGSGDDAISGAEALDHAWVPTYDTTTGLPDGVLDLGYAAVNLDNLNPGDVLAFNPEDGDGQHLNNRFRAGEFALYDEYYPRWKVQLIITADDLDKVGTVYMGVPDPEDSTITVGQFLLNFDQAEGVFRQGDHTQPDKPSQDIEYSAVHDDGSDAIFGDLGNDWLVGGTGRDNVYGGWGNDLLNVDDDQDTGGTANDTPDTHPTYEDRAYGGAGRDVLIGNTGGDRLIDWVGEYNSYLVPYAPFGQASVSRTLQPFLPEFLYALSGADGADPSRAGKTGSESDRNGEPAGEMGLVLQKDVAWQDQTGAPADPQAGNIPGGQRDVLRTASFDNVNPLSALDGFAVDSGVWAVSKGALQVTAASLGKDAAAVFYVDAYLPNYYEVLASIKVTKPTAGWKANAYIIFDYYSSTDFKFAGVDVSLNRFVMGHRNAQGWVLDAFTPAQVKPDIYYNMLVAVNGTTATLQVNNTKLFTYVFAPRVVDGFSVNLNTGMVGVGSDNSRGVFDNISVRKLKPQVTFQYADDFGDGAADLFAGERSGTWSVSAGRYNGTTAAGSDLGFSIVDLGIGRGLRSGSMLEFETTLSAKATGGIVYDYYGPEDFKFVAVNVATNQVILGHRTARGWFTDAAVSRTIGTGDHKLGLSIRGTTVSVTLDGQAVTSFMYNAVLVDGFFGLFTAKGTSSFNDVSFRTDDPAFAKATTSSALTASETSVHSSSDTASLTYESLGPVLNEAVDRLAASTGASSGDVSWLNNVAFRITDLPGNTIGTAEGFTISLDSDAAGYGWSANGMDLLSAVEHELGHLLGFDHAAGTIMSPTLSAGERLTQSSAQALRNPTIFRPEADLLAPSLYGSGWNVSGAGLHDGSDWSVDMATLSSIYGRKGDDGLASYEGIGLYADAGRLWDSGPGQFGKEWEIDLGYDRLYGKGKASGKRGRTM